MPKGGQKPKPQMIKIMEGNRRKVARRELERPEPRGKGSPRVPAHLTAIERQIWAEAVGSLPDGLLCRADELMLERLAVAAARFRDVTEQIRRTGLLVASPNGLIRNPLLPVQNAAAKEMHATLSELGMSPVARARMVGLDLGPKDDPMELLLDLDEGADGTWAAPSRARN